MVLTLIALCILKNPCIPGIDPTWSWCMILLMCSWILSANILLRIFVSYVYQWSDQIRSDQSLSCVQLSATPWIAARQASLSITNSRSSLSETHIHRVSDAIQPSHPLSSPSPPAPNPSQHQSLFQWVNSSHEVILVCNFLFSWYLCLVFGVWLMVASQNEFESVLPSVIFWKSLRRIDVSS